MIWMTVRRFEWALRTRGTGLAAWPDRERQAALRLLRRSGAAQDMLAEMLAMEDGPQADPAAALRIQGKVRRALTPPTAVLRGMRMGAIAACAAAGLYFGLPALDFDFDAAPGPTMQALSPATVLAALDQ
ncbi:MAG: hypothetical protein ACRYGM_01670 [Janthinobacterium lividum]